MTRIRLPNFDKETSRQTRARSNGKQSVSGKRKAPLTTSKEKEPPEKEKGQPQRMCTGARVSDTT